MFINKERYGEILEELKAKNVTLVAVSKTKPVEAIMELYEMGQRDFGENYVQEMVDKYEQLPKDIRWHFIGHLQSNKVKYIVPFVHLVHGVDSGKLLKEIHKQAQKAGRVVDVLLQMHIASEETKFGLDEKELNDIYQSPEIATFSSVHVTGLMGMASFTEDQQKVRKEFEGLKSYFDAYSKIRTPNTRLQILSMGMSSDYRLALECGSTMVRIGSLIFGERTYAR